MNAFISIAGSSNVIGLGTMFDFADSSASLTFKPSSNGFSVG